ncbi:MAG: hypothetical protein ABL962_09055, partial [Fimbriimonadaceae bacterium]
MSAIPQRPRPSIYAEGYFGRAIPEFLGSEDPRKAHGFGVGVVLHAPRRLRWGRLVPELYVEG